MKLKRSESEFELFCLRKVISNLIDGSIIKTKANKSVAQEFLVSNGQSDVIY
jgi:hypothetical protein